MDPAGAPDGLVVQRREFKYLVDERTAQLIRAWIAGVCEPDRYAGPDGRYLIDSLYLDSLDLRLHRATVDNEPARHKLRIRGYPQAPGSPLFLEVKRRVDDVILKSRAQISRDRFVALLETGDVSLVEPEQLRATESFLSYYQVSRMGPMVPAVLVRYEREPYSSLIDNYARLTFDRSIQYQVASELTLDADDAAWMPIDDPRAMGRMFTTSLSVLELKFEDRAPGWMQRMITTLELPRLSFSKYARAIDAMLMRPGDRLAI